MSWKDGLSKKTALEYDLSRIIGKDHVFFPENMILHLRRKMEDHLSQKNTGKYHIFFRPSEKIIFSKSAASFLYNLERWWYNIIFSVYTSGCYKRGVTLFCQKKSRMVFSREYTHKSDWRSRLTSWKELQQFSVLWWRPLRRPFSCVALQQKKNRKLNI